MTDDQIKYMVDRFLGWKLPDNFTPDAGISFKPIFNEHLPKPMKHEPIGTNLFDASQAEQMVRYMVEGMPDLRPSSGEQKPDANRHEPMAWMQGGTICPGQPYLNRAGTPGEVPLYLHPEESLVNKELARQVLRYAKEKREIINRLRKRSEDWRWKANCTDIANAPANLQTCASEIDAIANDLDCFALPDSKCERTAPSVATEEQRPVASPSQDAIMGAALEITEHYQSNAVVSRLAMDKIASIIRQHLGERQK